ncbi:MAG: Gfo/Idh/MocA family oxidoreductase [Acidobacteria bacterium]|nr:Gfo/Idh/MocA family oxidoreductase [Acidobacteriota bacterium]
MNIAVIGLGFMGSTHLKALRNVPSARVAAVVSSDERKLTGDLTGIQGNLGGPGERMDFSALKRYRRPEEALADPEIEAVDICLPTHLHAPLVLAALRAGKHVLVEKPLALDGASADELVAEARRSGRVLMTGQVLRFVPSYRIGAEMVKSGNFGRVRSALFRRRCAAPAWGGWHSDPSKSGGGVFDLLIHDVDYCLHLLGAPDAVSAVGFENLPAGVDWIAARFHYRDAGPVLVTGGWHHPKAYPFSMEFTVVSDGGTFEYSSAGRPLTLYTAAGESQHLDRATPDLFQAELDYFIECASQGRRPDLCPPEESAAAVKLAKWMLESRSRNGEEIPCRL